MNNPNLRVVVPVAVLCALLGACASGGGKTTPAAEPSKPVAAPPAPAVEQPAPAPKKVVKKPAPAPAAEAQPKFEINTPQEPYIDTVPPSQPPQPAPAKPDASKVEAPKVDAPKVDAPKVETPASEPPPALVAPPLVKQPDAVAVLERAREKLAEVRTLDCITVTEATGPAAATIPGLGVRNRVQLRFQYDDAVSVPFFVITPLIPTPNGDALGPRATYDGTRAIIVDDATRTYSDPGRNWFDVVGPRLNAIPQWFFRERMTLARRKPDATVTRGSTLEAELIGARILGVEQFDGQECDVVELYFMKEIVKFSETTGAAEVVDDQRFTETVHFARADGMPRKVVMRDVPRPDAPAGSGSTITSQYLKMVVNPGHEADFFDTSIPAGYLPQQQR